MSDGSVITTIVTWLVRPLVDVIWKEVDYLFRPKKYVEDMSSKVQQLVLTRNEVQDEVDEAERFGQDVGPEVRTWLSSVDEIIERRKALSTARQSCFNGWCVDLCSQYRVNKAGNRITRSIELLPDPPVLVALAPAPPGMPPSNPNVQEFESTKLTMQLIMEALADESCDLIGVVGVEGVGKTTIVTRIAEKVKKNFDQVVMAVVSQTPDVRKIQDEIASMLRLKLDREANELGRASQLHDRILRIKRILVILDDIWVKLDLNAVGVPYGIQHKGCKILLTTREDQVCIDMRVRADRRVSVQPLSEDESWELFRKNAGDQIDSPSLREIAEGIMGKCGGLPKTLVTTGSALREKDVNFWTAAKKELEKSQVKSSILSSNPDVLELESTTSTMQLIMKALRDESCDIVGVVGTGGVGKTTIVTQIKEKIKANRQFEQVVMAVVSQTPDVRRIQDHIASILKLKQEEKASDSERARELRKSILKIGSILVILDDIWAELDLHAVGIPYGDQHKGCKILLTTREDQVCIDMRVSPDWRVPVQPLSEKESWELFRKIAGDKIDSPPLKKIAEDVMGECKGLPLALVTVGGALREKDLYYWTAAKGELKKSKVTLLRGVSPKVLSCIKLSYNYIEGKDAKLLFLLCSLFPEDYNIWIENLVKYALGKRSLFEDEDTVEDARRFVHATIDNLKASHLLLKGVSDDFIKMHDVVRDVAIYITSSQGENDHRFLIRTGQGLTEWPRSISMEQCTAVSLMHNDIKELSEKEGRTPDAAKLEILSLRRNRNLHKITDSFFKGMKMLSVLDLSGAYSGSLHMSSFQCLTCLRTLLLDGSKIDDMSGIGKLKQLQILSLRFCVFSNKALPVELGELSRLRLLDLSRCSDIKRVPANVISRLSRLEELEMNSFEDWEVDENASLSEVRSLPRLAKICVSIRGWENFPAGFTPPHTVSRFSFWIGIFSWEFVRNYNNSEKSCLRVGFQNQEEVERSLCLAGALKVDCLELHGHDIGYPLNQIVEEVTLTDLLSDKCGVSYNITAVTSTTPATAAKAVFPNLQQLELITFHFLGSLGIHQLPHGSLQNLTVLEIQHCRSLSGAAVPSSWVQRLHNLEQIHIRHCRQVTEIFENNNTPSPLLPRLREIELYMLLHLTAIWNNTTRGTLHNFFPANSTSLLTRVRISFCDKLVSIFPPGVSQSLSHLQTLQVDYCQNLEKIFGEDGMNISPPIRLPNLQSVSISWCRKMMCLFTVSTARSTPRLEILHLDSSFELQEIVSRNNNGVAGDETQISWPHLRTMKLVYLRSLSRMCPANCSIDVPELESLSYYECPAMENFASDTSEFGLKIPPSVIPQLQGFRFR